METELIETGTKISTELTPAVLALVPIVAGIIQLLKKIPAITKISDWLPIVSLLLSVGLCFSISATNPVLSGVAVGLMASGAYSALKGATPTK